MNINTPYKTMTSEQFLFHEMRITAKLFLEGKDNNEILNDIMKDNLFQYPTERKTKELANVCIRRLKSLNDDRLVAMIADGSSGTAKQVCLYAMMNYYRIMWEFMLTVVAEKYRTKDFSFSRRDVSVFFTRLQEQNDEVAKWSDSTIKKMIQVITKILVENEYIDNIKSETLNLILIDHELKNNLLERKDFKCLEAFNCFEE